MISSINWRASPSVRRRAGREPFRLMSSASASNESRRRPQVMHAALCPSSPLRGQQPSNVGADKRSQRAQHRTDRIRPAKITAPCRNYLSAIATRPRLISPGQEAIESRFERLRRFPDARRGRRGSARAVHLASARWPAGCGAAARTDRAPPRRRAPGRRSAATSARRSAAGVAKTAPRLRAGSARSRTRRQRCARAAPPPRRPAGRCGSTRRTRAGNQRARRAPAAKKRTMPPIATRDSQSARSRPPGFSRISARDALGMRGGVADRRRAADRVADQDRRRQTRGRREIRRESA